jgi:uncharacterized membrane protein
LSRKVNPVSEMFEVNASRIVDCPIEDAFLYLCNLENDPDWWTGVREVKCTSASPYGVGATYWQMNALFGLRFAMDIEVTRFDWYKRMDFRSTSKTLAPFVATYLFRQGGNGTEVTMLGQSAAAGIGFKLFGPLFRAGLRYTAERNFDTLKRVLDDRGRRLHGTGLRSLIALPEASARP